MEKNEDVETRRSSEHSSSINSCQDGTTEAAPKTENVLTLGITPPPTKTEEGDWEYVTGFKLHVVIVTVTLACFIMLLDTSIVSTAIPRITNQFHSLSDIGWYGSSYLLANCALQPMTGKLYSQFSSKYTFICFLALFELGSLICGVARSSDMLIIGRAVAGIGGSGLMNGALTIVAACVPLEKRAVNLGIMIGVAQLGILLGPLIGGAFTTYTTWRWCFYINLPIGGIVAASLIFIDIPDRRDKSQIKTTVRSILQSLDLPGFALFAPTVIMFLLALEWGGTRYAWHSATVIGLFCGSGGNLAIFLAWEYKRGDTAMIPLGMVKQRIIWTSCVVMFFFGGALLISSYYLAIYFQAVRGVTPLLSGVYLLPSILSQMVMAVLSGFLVGRLGYYLPWMISSGAISTLGVGLISTFTPSTSTAKWIGYQIIFGIGRGCGMQMPIVAIQNHLPASQNSIGMSLIVFSQTLGGSLFLSFAQTALSAGLKHALPILAPDVDPQVVINAGATGFRAVVPNGSLQGVILSYCQAVNHVFYIATGAAVGTFIFSWGMGWKSVKKAKKVEPVA